MQIFIRMIKIVTNIILLITIAFSQDFFPKIAFLDPFTATKHDSFSSFHPRHYGYYADELAECGFNVIHTKKQNEPLDTDYLETLQSRGFMVVSEQWGGNNPTNISYVFNGYQEIWPVGFNTIEYDFEHHLNFMYYRIFNENSGEFWTDVGDNPEGDFDHTYYIRSLVGTHNSGLVLDGSDIVAGTWRNSGGNANDINLFIKGYIDTNGNQNISNTDTVVTFKVYESDGSDREFAIDEEPSSHPNFYPDSVTSPRTLRSYELSFLVSDFDSPGLIENIRHPTTMNLNAYNNNGIKTYTHVDMIWHGYVDFYLDGFELRSDFNQRLFIYSDSTNYFQQIQNGFEEAYDYNGGQLNMLHRFYFDEPRYNEYRSLGKLNELVKNITSTSILSATGSNGHKSLNQYKFVEYVDPEEVLYNYYPIRGNYYSSGSQNTTHNSVDTVLHYNRTLQDAWNELIERLHTVSYESYSRNVPFMHTVQVQSSKNIDDNRIMMRNPLTSEISAQVWIALAHNAKGIMYFLYSSGVFDRKYNGLVDIGGDPNEYDPSLGPYIPNEKYYEVKRINKKLKILESILLDLEWKNSFSSEQGSPNEDNPFPEHDIISSITSIERETPYIEIGQFSHTETGEEYFILVNKRCCIEDDGECAGNESQTLEVTLNTDGDKYIEDILALHEPWDGNEHRVASRYLPEGENSFQVFLKPGEGRLFRITDGLKGNFSDNIYLSGEVGIEDDVTLHPGADLTIYPGTNIEFTSSSNLNIYGNISALGTESSPIELKAKNNGENWGSLVLVNSIVEMNHTIIENVNHINIHHSGGNFNNIEFSSQFGVLVRGENSFFTNCLFTAEYNNAAAVGLLTVPGMSNNVATFSNCEFYNSNIGLLTGYNSSPSLEYNSFYDNNIGLFSNGNSKPILIKHTLEAGCNTTNNVLVGNETGVFIEEDAQPLLGFDVLLGGYNRLDNTHDIINNATSQQRIYASLNHWDSGYGCSPSLPNNVFGMVRYIPTVNDIFGEDSNLEYAQYQALYAEAEENFEQAIQHYDQLLVGNSSDSLLALWSLSGISRCYQKMENIDNLISYTDSKAMMYSGTPIEKYSRNYNITAQILLENFMQAESKIMEFEQDYPDFEMMDKIEFEKALIAEYQENNSAGRLQSDNPEIVKQYSLSEKAKKRYQVVAEKYSDTGFGILARMKLDGLMETEDENNIPTKYQLMTIYPNPFNPTTTIQVELQKPSQVSLTIYNILGQQVKRLSDAFMQIGAHKIQWDGRNDSREPLANGMYFIRLETDSITDLQKVVLLK